MEEKLRLDFERNSHIFPDEGKFALDSLSWKMAFHGYISGIIDEEDMNQKYEHVLNIARSLYPKYEFHLHIDPEDCHGNFRVWLYYSSISSSESSLSS
jgi:hypothetical protein